MGSQDVMNHILCCDWLPKVVRLCYLSSLGLPAWNYLLYPARKKSILFYVFMDLQSWTKAVETLSEINSFHSTHEFVYLQFSQFDPLSLLQCCSHVTVSMKRISTLKRGRGGNLAINKKVVVFNYRRMPIESVCFAQN